MPSSRQNAAPGGQPPRAGEGREDATVLEDDDRGREAQPDPEEDVEQDRRELPEEHDEGDAVEAVGLDEQGDARPDEHDEDDEGATRVTRVAPSEGGQAALRAVPRLADADLAPEDGLTDDVGEEAGEGDRRQERAEGRDVVGEDAQTPTSVDSKSPFSRLPSHPPRAVVGTRQASEVTTARPMVAATLPRTALVTAE